VPGLDHPDPVFTRPLGASFVLLDEPEVYGVPPDSLVPRGICRRGKGAGHGPGVPLYLFPGGAPGTSAVLWVRWPTRCGGPPALSRQFGRTQRGVTRPDAR
jgi:hypothetical protein